MSRRRLRVPRFYIGLFSLLVVGIVIGQLFLVVGAGEDWREAWADLQRWLIRLVLPVGLLVVVAHVMAGGWTRLRLFLYYVVKVRLVFGRLSRIYARRPGSMAGRLARSILDRWFDEDYEKLIFQSWARPGLPWWVPEQKGPVFVRRKDLELGGAWPNWAFCEVLLFNGAELVRAPREGAAHFQLKVDLTGQSYGIYNNLGKVFLEKTYLSDPRLDAARLEMTKEIEAFFAETHGDSGLQIPTLDGPLRWASGGVLPVARFRGRHWYVLSFRGIPPVGWNIANGGSENEDEYRRLPHLMVRELFEEIILLSGEPIPGSQAQVIQKTFDFPAPAAVEPVLREQIATKGFLKRHEEMRRLHDGLAIDYGPVVELSRIRTNCALEVTHERTESVPNVVISINLFESGVEVVGIYSFEMADRDYLLFGEVSEGGDCLLREPMLLLDCEYVRETFDLEHGLGRHISAAGPHRDCKQLEAIPSGSYVLFDRDIEFREQRLAQLNRETRLSEAGEFESELHRAWLSQFGLMFAALSEKKDIDNREHEAATMLCPVTWKTIEFVCRHDLLGHVLH